MKLFGVLSTIMLFVLSSLPLHPPVWNTLNDQSPSRQEIVLDEGIQWLANGQGSAWVWNSADQTIGQIDLATGSITGIQIPLDFEPISGSAEADTLWLLSDDRGRVERIDLKTYQVMGTVDISPHFEEWEYVRLVTGEGTVWVKGEETVLQIDALSNEIIGQPITAGEEVLFAVVSGGELWTGSHDDGLITRIDIETHQINEQFDVGFSVHGLAVAEGEAWILDEHGFAIVQVDPASNTIINRIPIDFVASNIALFDGYVWVAPSAFNNGPTGNDVFAYIDPQTGVVVREVAVGKIADGQDGYYLSVVEEGESWAVIFHNPTRLVRLSEKA